MTTEHRVANRTWVFYEKRSVGSSHKKERWVLPSKQNTLYKLIRLLELVSDGGEITWRQIYANDGEVRNETQSGVWCWGNQGTSRRLGSEENRDMGLRSIRGDEGNIKPEVRDKRLHGGPEMGKAQWSHCAKTTDIQLALFFTYSLRALSTYVHNN